MFFGDNEIAGIGQSVNVEADMSYSGAIGAQLVMAEGYQNDFAMFNGALLSDIKEAGLIREGASEADITAVQEGALSSMWEKIKNFIKKIMAKVKGIWKSFIAKLEAWMGRDGRAFFDKYKRDIFGKDVSGLKVRYSKPKFSSLDLNVGDLAPDSSIAEDTTKEELVERYLKGITGLKATPKEFRKEFHSECFEDEEKDYEVKDVAGMVSFISGKEDPIAKMKKAADAQEKILNEYIKKVDAYQKSVIDNTVSDKGSDARHDYTKFGNKLDSSTTATGKMSNSEAQRKAASYQRQVAALQEALSIANSAFITEIKFAVSQSRRVAAAIVAYRGKKNEDVELLLNAQESAEYEFYSDMEAC